MLLSHTSTKMHVVGIQKNSLTVLLNTRNMYFGYVVGIQKNSLTVLLNTQNMYFGLSLSESVLLITHSLCSA